MSTDALTVVAEPRRREILRLVWDEEHSAGEIAAQFPVTFGAVSHHLTILREAGLVRMRRDGKRRLYRADRAALGDLAPALEAIWAAGLDRLARAAEQPEP